MPVARTTGHVKKFFREFCDELSRQLGSSDEEIGFMDSQNIDVGAVWTNELEDALCNSRVFLALYSPTYFTRDFCGREWAVFSERVRRFEALTGVRSNAMVPILWIPQEDLPTVAGQIQHSSDQLGALYGAYGLFRLINLRQFEDEYRILLSNLARRVIDIVRTGPQLPSLSGVDLRQVRSAFPADWLPSARRAVERRRAPVTPPVAGHPAVNQTASARVIPPQRRAPARWPKHVHFVVAATSSQDLPPQRTARQFYGDYPEEWRPFAPETAETIILLAQGVARSQGFTSTPVSLDEGILGPLEVANSRNQIVVLLVDVWVVLLDTHRQLLNEYDERNEPTTGVLVPHSESDSETRELARGFHDFLRRAFPRNMRRLDPLFRADVSTAARFDNVLREVITEAQNRVFRHGEPQRPARGATPIGQPILSGP